MFSQLGQLPEFGAGLGLTSRANTNGGIGDLDDDLEFLLGDNSKSKSTRGRSKSQPKQSTSK